MKGLRALSWAVLAYNLAVVNWGSSDLTVRLGIGDGTFLAAANFAVGTNPRSVAIGDLNGDGNLDVAVTKGEHDRVTVTRASQIEHAVRGPGDVRRDHQAQAVGRRHQAEGERHPEETDAHLRKRGGEHRAAASAKDQPEGPEALVNRPFRQ